MPKLSKTAAAAMKAVEAGESKNKKDPFDTNEKKIAELRILRQARLAINRYDFIDALLEEYDNLIKENNQVLNESNPAVIGETTNANSNQV